MARPSILVAAASVAWLAVAFAPLGAQESKKAAEPSGAKDNAGPKDNASTKAPAQIGQWIKQLDDDDFQVRESATGELTKAGQAAVAPLTKAAAEAGLEVTVRAIQVLTQLGVSDDSATAEAARLALEGLAENKAAAVRERADAALEMLDGLEADRALKKVESYGGYFAPPAYVVASEPPMAALMIKEGKWTGGDDGLGQLRFLRDVRMVSVYCKLTDEAVPYLTKLKHLRVLRLYSTGISEKGLLKIKAALPDVDLEVRGGQLGIEGDKAAARCQVKNVIRNTAASKAGVQAGDIIVKCDGKAVETFNSLVEAMRPKSPGTKVKLEILRGEKTLERELTLEAWRDLSSEGPLDEPER